MKVNPTPRVPVLAALALGAILLALGAWSLAFLTGSTTSSDDPPVTRASPASGRAAEAIQVEPTRTTATEPELSGDGPRRDATRSTASRPVEPVSSHYQLTLTVRDELSGEVVPGARVQMAPLPEQHRGRLAYEDEIAAASVGPTDYLGRFRWALDWNGGPETVWRTGEDGTAFLELPRSLPFWLLVAHPDPGAVPSEVLMLPAETRGQERLEIRLAPLVELRGRVLDQDGVGVVGVNVGIRSAATNRASAPVATSSTVATGVFKFNLPAGNWWLDLIPDTRQEEVLAWRGIEVQVRGTSPEPLVIPVGRNLFLAGVVVDVDGLPRPDLTVELGNAPVLPRPDRTDADGAFELGPLMPGSHGIEVRAGDLDLSISPDSAASGTLNLVVRIDGAASVNGRVVDARTGDPVPVAPVSVYVDQAGPAPAQTLAGGEFHLRGLPEGALEVVAETRDGRVGQLRGVTAVRGVQVWLPDLRVHPGAELLITAYGFTDPAVLVVRHLDVDFERRISIRSDIPRRRTARRLLRAPLGSVEVSLEDSGERKSSEVVTVSGRRASVTLRSSD